MNFVKINHKLFEDIWNIDVNNIGPTATTFYLNLISNNNIDLKPLEFYVSITQQDTVIYSGKFPKEYYRYVASDQNHIESFQVEDLKPNKKYKCRICLNLDTYSSNYEFSFMTGMPAQPYASWSWDGESWCAPVIKPDDENHYEWNEIAQEWQKVAE